MIIPMPPKLVQLARSFHSLESAPMRHLDELGKWARPKSHGERLAVAFIYSVWSGSPDAFHGIRPFELHEALGTWDAVNRAAFIEWVKEPWWL